MAVGRTEGRAAHAVAPAGSAYLERAGTDEAAEVRKVVVETCETSDRYSSSVSVDILTALDPKPTSETRIPITYINS